MEANQIILSVKRPLITRKKSRRRTVSKPKKIYRRPKVMRRILRRFKLRLKRNIDFKKVLLVKDILNVLESVLRLS